MKTKRTAQSFNFIERKGPYWELPQTRFLGDTEIYAVNTELSINRMYANCLELPILIQTVQAEVSQDLRTSSSYVGRKHAFLIAKCET